MKLLLLLSILLSTNFLYAQNTCSIKLEDNYGVVNTGDNVTINYYMPIDAFNQRFEQFDAKLTTIATENQQLKAQIIALQKKEKQDFAKLQTQINAVVKDNTNLQKNQELLAEQIKNIAQANTERQKLVATLPQNTTQELSTQLTQIATQIACVQNLTADYKNDLETVQDKQGNTQIVLSLEKLKNDPRYSLIGDFSDGLATAKFGTKYGYIDQNYKTVIDYQYDEALPFSYGMAAVKRLSGWKYIDKQNNIVQKLENVTKVSSFTSQFDLHNDNSVFDKEKKQVVLKYEEISFYTDKLIQIKNNGKWKLYDLKLQAIEETEYSFIAVWDKTKKIAIVQNEKGYNFINATSKTVSNEWFKEVSNFDENGLMMVDNGLMNTNGTMVVATKKYDKLKSVVIEKIPYYHYLQNGKEGLLDKTGKIICETKYSNLDFDNLGYTKVYEDGYYFYHYKTGLLQEYKNLESVDDAPFLEEKFAYKAFRDKELPYLGYVFKEGKFLEYVLIFFATFL